MMSAIEHVSVDQKEHTSTSEGTTWKQNKMDVSRQYIHGPRPMRANPTTEDAGIGVIVIVQAVKYCFCRLAYNASANVWA